MGTVLALAAYGVTAYVYLELTWRMVVCLRSRRSSRAAGRSGPTPVVMAVVDIMFLRRLFLLNKGLWVGEWIFHVSFVLVVARHLRFFFLPVPGWIGCFQTPGIYAGYMLPLSLLYIVIYRFAVERGRYFSPYNLFLTVTIFLISATGLLMRTAFRADLAAVKGFVMNWLALMPADAPDSNVFIVHFILVLVLAAFLPSHVFTAPFVTMEAWRREEEREMLLHGKK